LSGGFDECQKPIFDRMTEIRHSRGENARLGHARERIDLVEKNFTVFADKEVDPREMATAQNGKNAFG
jgi:hypothetical protein